VRTLHLKLILLFRFVPKDDINFGSCWRDSTSSAASPYVSGGRGAVRAEEARTWLEDRRNEAIAEITLLVSTLAMIAAIVAAVRR
jgi:hypothetical protein